ncbi:MAG: 16S rRNA (cytosine(1402)-N(4))-methyltransferase [Bacteroidetes bacterium 4572_117]|nr:MAG: 16S rRNA (cytosine(1402)-N(4))-methyltransferase [Bacteroidetes bacterium 4572_117]
MSTYHTPVLLQECIQGLNIKPGGVYVDVTFGGGGHSKEILKNLGDGRLIAFDQDEDAHSNIIDDKRFLLIRSNFKYIKNYLRYFNITKVDGILADLGISSFHIDAGSRGFSFKADASMDMRMNKAMKKSAADLLNEYPEIDLMKIFRLYGEIKNAGWLAKCIVTGRKNQKISGITDFINMIKNEIPKKQENKYLAKVFQAIRIELNDEIAALEDFLMASGDLIKINGRLVVLSYHSLEDRYVKNYIRTGKCKGELDKDIYGNYETPFKAVNRKVIVPDEEELMRNSRSRSAKLRIAEKI